MVKYAIGDQVVLVRSHPMVGRYGIPEQYFGLTFTVKEASSDFLFIAGYDNMFSVYPEMVDPQGGPW